MKLYKYYECEEGRIFACCIDGQLHFFYEGFESKEAAYKAAFNYIVEHLQLDFKHCPKSMLEEGAKVRLEGVWDKIH